MTGFCGENLAGLTESLHIYIHVHVATPRHGRVWQDPRNGLARVVHRYLGVLLVFWPESSVRCKISAGLLFRSLDGFKIFFCGKLLCA